MYYKSSLNSNLLNVSLSNSFLAHLANSVFSSLFNLWSLFLQASFTNLFFQFTKIVSSKQNAWSQILTPEVLFRTSFFLSEWFSKTRKNSCFQAHSAVVTKSCFWRFVSLTQARLVPFGLPCCLALLGPLLQTEDATWEAAKRKPALPFLDNFALGVQIGTSQVSKAVFQAKGAEERNRC